MDSFILYKISEKTKFKIDWIKPSDTEWIYCGAVNEVKWNVVSEELDSFFVDSIFHVVTTRTKSFTINKQGLIPSIQDIVGCKNFFVWNEGFKKVIEFNNIGVFRKGIFNSGTNNESFRRYPNKMAPGSPDKVKGKLVKYRKGDCLSVLCGNGKYLAVLISEKFNKYYDFTLLEYLDSTKPTMNDFLNGRFFGCYLGGRTPTVEKLMLECLIIDADPSVEKLGSLELIEPLEYSSYGCRKDVGEVLQHYEEDIRWRIQNSINYEKMPEKFFAQKRLIDVAAILKSGKH